MTVRSVTRALIAGWLVSGLLVLAAPAAAQSARGGLGGKIVDAEGKPVPDAEVILENPEVNLRYVVKTNSKGEWAQGGMPVGNRMNIVARKGTLEGGMKGVPVRQGSIMEIPDIVITAAAPPADAARKAMEAEMTKVAAEVNALIAANDYDGAITKFNELATKLPNCALCYDRIGDLYIKKSQWADAEKALLKAIELDANDRDAYSMLVTVYNQQKRYDEASKANDKASALAAGPLGMGVPGGGDANSSFNAGALALNMQLAAEKEGKADVAATKMKEAQAHFERAIQLKPDMAEAYYELGMLYVKQNKIPDAKKMLAEYLKLAPNGPNAEMAKAIASMP
ncbi:MAG: tetratricopeptide repeat protein [Acidobacteria bacterium]|nr:tetratricopeptide repeat protein [Acidobacteriota bacterium]